MLYKQWKHDIRMPTFDGDFFALRAKAPHIQNTVKAPSIVPISIIFPQEFFTFLAPVNSIQSLTYCTPCSTTKSNIFPDFLPSYHPSASLLWLRWLHLSNWTHKSQTAAWKSETLKHSPTKKSIIHSKPVKLNWQGACDISLSKELGFTESLSATKTQKI